MGRIVNDLALVIGSLIAAAIRAAEVAGAFVTFSGHLPWWTFPAIEALAYAFLLAEVYRLRRLNSTLRHQSPPPYIQFLWADASPLLSDKVVKAGGTTTLGNPYFARVMIENKAPTGIRAGTATDATCRVRFYDEKGFEVFNLQSVTYARWANNAHLFQRGTDLSSLNRLTLKPNGEVYTVHLALKYLDDDAAYAVNYVSVRDFNSDWRHPDWGMPRSTYYVLLSVKSSEMLNPAEKWFALSNQGQGQAIGLLMLGNAPQAVGRD